MSSRAMPAVAGPRSLNDRGSDQTLSRNSTKFRHLGPSAVSDPHRLCCPAHEFAAQTHRSRVSGATGLLRIPLSERLEMFAVEELSKLTQICLSEFLVGADLDRMMLHASTFHGSTNSTPVCWKSFTLRVAQIAPCVRQIAAICASAVLIGAPALSRATSTSA